MPALSGAEVPALSGAEVLVLIYFFLNIKLNIQINNFILSTRRNILVVLFILYCIHTSIGQQTEITNTRIISFNSLQDTTILVSETVIPGSIYWEVKNDSIYIPFSLIDNSIQIENITPGAYPDSITLHYKVLPYPFHREINLFDSSQIKMVAGDIYYDPIRPSTRNELIESTGLQYDGALTRGVSAGNNQSLVFDSELNLQLSGNIGDGYGIRAAITDNNLPIQPDGTTRQLQEFDKVFIEITKDQHAVLAGDFDAINSPGYFMRYNRKLKGAQYSYSGKPVNQPWSFKGSAAVSRGKFTRQTIIPSEGNQGPYPLRGENGELFIIVLAGSEKVFIDGRQLIRGEDADYIMDYNQSEITFTRNILINVRHRITVEFEYAQFNFQKSHNAFEARYDKERLQSFVQFFQEKDSKTVTGDLELTPEDLTLLSMAGDAGERFYKSGIRATTENFNTNAILYTSIDTIVEGVLYEDVLRWSTQPENANLIVSFSEVGVGGGDYIISPNPSPNGRVYQWVAPDETTGDKSGNFSPLLPLQPPQQKQMLTAGVQYKLKHNGLVSAETGLSRNDLNRYSPIDDNDNFGAAIKVNITQPVPLGIKWTLTPFGGYESSGASFRVLDPYRNPEFVRDWNLPQTITTSHEQLPTMGLRIGTSRKFFLQYQYDGLFRTGVYNGNRHSGQLNIDSSGWKINGLVSLLEAKDFLNTTKFVRPSFTVERVVLKEGDWRLGTSYFEDRNEVRDKGNDSLRFNSFIQNRFSAYIRNNPEALTHLQLGFHQERPKLVSGNQFVLSEKVSEWNLSGHFHQLENLKLDYTVRHRDAEPLLQDAGNRNINLLGRLDLRADLIKKAIKYSAGYEIGNGQEPKAEFKYIKVPKGEGIYIWVDDGDGVEEVNEFEQAPFADQGEYIKLSVFNNEFIRTRSLNIQQSVNFDLRLIKPVGLLSKIAFLSTYQLNRKIREENESPFWNPFYQQYPDTAILGNASTLRNILYWNRSSTAYDIQLGHLIQRNQILQTSGFEFRQVEDYTLRWRFSLQKKTDLVLNLRKGERENRSQFFANKTYLLDQLEAGPELNVILKDKFRITGAYQYLEQENRSGDEKFTSNKFSLEGAWRKSANIDIRAQISLIDIKYESLGNQNIDFAILQGLQTGENILWSAQFNTRITKSLVLTLIYNGRKTGDVKTIHTGSAQVRAAF